MNRLFYEYWARRRQRTAARMKNIIEFLGDAGYCLDQQESVDNDPY